MHTSPTRLRFFGLSSIFLWFIPATILFGEDQLWTYAPETISSGWAEIFVERGKYRNMPMPAPDNVALWTILQEKSRAIENQANQIAEDYNVTYTEMTLGGVPVIEVTPINLNSNESIAIYLHGGAYVLSSAKAAMPKMALFANTTGLKVIGIDYSLSPQSKWPEITNQVVAVFEALQEQDMIMSQIIIFGDSAGGGLAAGVTLKMRDLGMGIPAALVLWSPWTDISGVGDSYISLRDAEPYYIYERALKPAAMAYADEKDHHHPYVSPAYGDFTKGFPPTLIQGGTKELLLSDFVRLYQALDQAGQEVKLDIYEGMPHVHMAELPDSPESNAALKKVYLWVNEHL